MKSVLGNGVKNEGALSIFVSVGDGRVEQCDLPLRRCLVVHNQNLLFSSSSCSYVHLVILISSFNFGLVS